MQNNWGTAHEDGMVLSRNFSQDFLNRDPQLVGGNVGVDFVSARTVDGRTEGSPLQISLIIAQLLEPGDTPGRLTRLLSSGRSRNLREALSSLSQTQQRQLADRFGSEDFSRLVGLSRLRNSESFYQGLFNIGQSQVRRGNLDFGMLAYQALGAQWEPGPVYIGDDLRSAATSLQARAQRELNAIRGIRGFTRERARFLAGTFIQGATDFATLSAMVGAGATYHALRFGLMGRMAAIGLRGPGVRLTANLFAYSGESLAFVGYGRLGASIFHGQPLVLGENIGHEILGSFIMLGALKLSGASATGLFNQVHQNTFFRNLEAMAAQRTAFGGAGMFAGLWGATELEQSAGLEGQTSLGQTLMEVGATWLQFQAMGGVLHRFSPARFQAAERQFRVGETARGRGGDGWNDPVQAGIRLLLERPAYAYGEVRNSAFRPITPLDHHSQEGEGADPRLSPPSPYLSPLVFSKSHGEGDSPFPSMQSSALTRGSPLTFLSGSQRTGILRTLAGESTFPFEVWLARVLRGGDPGLVDQLLKGSELREQGVDLSPNLIPLDREGMAADLIGYYHIPQGNGFLQEIVENEVHPFRWRALAALERLDTGDGLSQAQREVWIPSLMDVLRQSYENPEEVGLWQPLSKATNLLSRWQVSESALPILDLFELRTMARGDHRNNLPQFLLKALGNLRFEGARSHMEYWSDPSRGTRLLPEALQGLARLGGPVVLERLVRLFRQNPEKNTRVEVVEALGILEGEEVDSFLEIALESPEPSVRLRAAQALVQREHLHPATEVLRRIALGQNNYLQFRLDAIEALGRLEGEEVLDTLERIFKNPQGSRYRDDAFLLFDAARALVRHGVEGFPVEVLLSNLESPLVEKGGVMQINNRSVPFYVGNFFRIGAIRSLSQAGVGEAIPLLKGLLHYPGRPVGMTHVGGMEIRGEAALGLGRLDPHWDEKIIADWNGFQSQF